MKLRRPCLGVNRPCPYGALTTATRCGTCAAEHERTRRPPSNARYGPQHQARHHAAIAAEPWCHWRGGCEHADAGTPANPLTADHPVSVAAGGDPQQELIALCRRHNSAKGAASRWSR